MTIQSTYGTWGSFTWPFPRVLYNGQQFIGFALESTNLYVFEMRIEEGDWTATYIASLGTASEIVSVDVAGFGKYYVLAVETDEITCYAKDVSVPIGTSSLTEFSPATGVVGSTVCNFKGQVIFGNLFSQNSKWSELGQCSVAWSGIGNAVFDPSIDPSAGMITMPWDNNRNGRVYKVKRLGKTIAVYGDNGRALLVPFSVERTTGFGLRELTGLGIPQQTCVGGDTKTHCFIDQNHNVWIATDKPTFEKLGYKEWMDDLFESGNDVVISYSQGEKNFYISDGNYCFVLTEHGMYSTNQCHTCVFDFGSTLGGLFYDNTDYEPRLTFSQTDFGIRGLKTLESMDFHANHDHATELMYGRVDVRYDYKSGFRNGSWIRLNDVGTITPIMTGNDFKIRFKGPTYTAVTELTIEDVVSRIKAVDKRGIRGTYGN